MTRTAFGTRLALTALLLSGCTALQQAARPEPFVATAATASTSALEASVLLQGALAAADWAGAEQALSVLEDRVAALAPAGSGSDAFYAAYPFTSALANAIHDRNLGLARLEAVALGDQLAVAIAVLPAGGGGGAAPIALRPELPGRDELVAAYQYAAEAYTAAASGDWELARRDWGAAAHRLEIIGVEVPPAWAPAIAQLRERAKQARTAPEALEIGREALSAFALATAALPPQAALGGGGGPAASPTPNVPRSVRMREGVVFEPQFQGPLQNVMDSNDRLNQRGRQ